MRIEHRICAECSESTPDGQPGSMACQVCDVAAPYFGDSPDPLLPCGQPPGSCSASIPLACEGCGNRIEDDETRFEADRQASVETDDEDGFWDRPRPERPREWNKDAGDYR